MSNELLCPWESPELLLFSSNVPVLLPFSHFIAAASALFVGLLVFFALKRNTFAKTFLVAMGLFVAWVFLDWATWATNRSDIVMYLWSLTIIVELMVFAAMVYVSRLYFKKEHLPFWGNLLIFILFLPVLILMPTDQVLPAIDLSWCDASEGFIAARYTYFFELIMVFWILHMAVKAAVDKISLRKTQISLFVFGVLTFLVSFTSGNIVGSITEDWEIAQYGLFGMPVFVAILLFSIVQYRLLNIKLIGSVLLVFALWFANASLLLVEEPDLFKLIVQITLAISVIFGVFLIRGVQREVEQREKLEKVTEDLEKANSKLRDLDKLKSEFLSFASHQLRNPLSAVKGYASMLLEGDYGKINDEPKQAVSTIYQATDSLVQMVQDFLDVSKIEQGGMKYQKEKIDLKKLVTQIVTELEPAAKMKKISLNTHIKDGDYSVLADEVKLKQVIVNVVDNAIKYTPEGSIDVYLESKSDWIQVRVKDSGVGIEKDDVERLFAKFVRAKDAHRHNTHGSGLGMYLAKMIIDAHHGHIRAESEGKGKGTMFVIELKKELK